MKRVVSLAFYAALASSVSMTAAAQAPASKSMDMKSMDREGMDGKKSASGHSGTGVVKSIDPATGSVMLAHEPVRSLSWPAMTMAFKVQDKKMLDKVKTGDKIHFQFVQSGKDYLITDIR